MMNAPDAGPRLKAGAIAAIAAIAGVMYVTTGASAAPGPTDLALTKGDSADPVTQGDSFTYTIQAANTGANDATDVIVTDILPSQLSYISSSTTAGTCSRDKQVVTCNLGTVDAGVTATITIAVKAAKSGTVSNTASLSTTVADSNTANDSDTESTVVSKKPGKPKGGKAKPSCAAPTIVGTPGNDTISGTSRADVIRAFSGNDVVFGLRGKDLICADRGADLVVGGSGDDTAIGAPGNDRLVGSDGKDVLKGKAGRDKLRGKGGNDFLSGGRGRDNCRGGSGDDTLLSCP